MSYFVESEYESVFWVPSIAVPTAPTIAELAAGTNITDDARTIAGFSSRATMVDVETLKGGFVPKISGRKTAQDSAITYAEHHTFALNVIKAVLVEGLVGFVVWSRYAKNPVASAKLDVFPSRIAGNNRTRDTSNKDAQYVVDFALTASPFIDVALAA